MKTEEITIIVRMISASAFMLYSLTCLFFLNSFCVKVYLKNKQMYP